MEGNFYRVHWLQVQFGGLNQKNGREETSLEGLFSSLLMGVGMGLGI